MLLEPTPSSSGKGAEVLACHNLRASAGCDGSRRLQPVGRPGTVASGKWRPLIKATTATGGRHLIVVAGRELGFIDLDRRDDGQCRVETISTLEADVTCAVASSADTVVIMTTDGAYRIDFDHESSSWTSAGAMPSLPGIAIVADDVQEIETTVARRHLSGSYQGESRLSESDYRAVSSDIVGGYERLANEARAAGRLIQPVLAYYKLMDKNGNELFRSSPVLVSLPEGCQCYAPVSIGADDSRSVLQPYVLRARAYRLKVSVTGTVAAPWRSIIARADIMVSPQFHPLDYDEKAAYDMVYGSSAGDFLRISLPGANTGVSPLNVPGAKRMIVRAIERIDAIASCYGSVECPFGSADAAGVGVMISNGSPFSAKAEAKALKKALMAASGRKRTAAEALLMSPHRLSAKVVASASQASVWGDLEAVRFDGYPLTVFASSISAGKPWHAAVQIKFASGDETTVWQGDGTDGAPEMLSPVLTYPSPDAIEMYIILSVEGKTRTGRFRLTPDSEGLRSIYVHDSLAPFVLPEEAHVFVVPERIVKIHRFPENIAVADANAPTALKAVAVVTSGRINALVSGAHGSGSWDFGRARFYSLGSAGIHSIVVNAARDAMSVNRIDPRPVASRQAVAYAGSSIIAVAGGGLVKISGYKATTLFPDAPFSKIAWNGKKQELWCIDQSDVATVYCFDYGGRRFTADMNMSDMLSDGDGDVYAVCDGDLVDLCEEDVSGTTAIEWRARMSMPEKPAGAGRLVIDMCASSVDGVISVSHGHLKDAYGEILTLNINGTIHAPVCEPFTPLPVDNVDVMLKGVVSRDLVFRGITVG